MRTDCIKNSTKTHLSKHCKALYSLWCPDHCEHLTCFSLSLSCVWSFCVNDPVTIAAWEWLAFFFVWLLVLNLQKGGLRPLDPFLECSPFLTVPCRCRCRIRVHLLAGLEAGLRGASHHHLPLPGLPARHRPGRAGRQHALPKLHAGVHRGALPSGRPSRRGYHVQHVQAALAGGHQELHGLQGQLLQRVLQALPPLGHAQGAARVRGAHHQLQAEGETPPGARLRSARPREWDEGLVVSGFGEERGEALCTGALLWTVWEPCSENI